MTEATLHFLRPWWLLSLIPIVFIGWQLWRQNAQKSSWNTLIADPFKPVLLSQQAQQKNVAPWIGLLLMWGITAFALSGPTWQKVEVPAEKNRQASVILLDLSLSMLADDLQPNRLNRARFQLIDLLKAHPEQQFGMVVYAGSAHTITPISEDPQTLINLMPSLSPLIMPSMGANVMAGLQQAQQLFEGAHINQGNLIWVTDSVETDEINAIKTLLKTHNLTLNIVAVGTAAGAPISVPNFGLLKEDNGQLVLAKLPLDAFQRLAEAPNIHLQMLDQTPLDTDSLLPPTFTQNQSRQADDKENEDAKTLSSWLDQGVYLLWLLLPLVALSFRRGWIYSQISISILPILLLSYGYPVNSYSDDTPSKDHSVSLVDVLKSNDHQGYENWQRQNYEAALNQFESPIWKGASYYRLQKYAEAAEQFKRSDSAESQYNLGNALAQLGKLTEAKTAYQNALTAKPNWQLAQQNLDIVEKLLEQQKQQQPQNGSQQNKSPQEASKNADEDTQSGQTKDSDNAADQNPQPNQNQNTSTQNQANDAQASEQPSDSNSADAKGSTTDSEDPQAKAEAKAEATAETDKPQQPNPAKTEAELAQQNWLNQIPHEPGLFLKRKFDYQFKQNRQPSSDKSKIW